MLELAITAAGEGAAHALDMGPCARAIRVRRLRYARGEPLALLTNYLPQGLVTLDAELLEERGRYQILREAGVHLRVAQQWIGARNATTAEASLLGGNGRAPLLTMTRIAYDDQWSLRRVRETRLPVLAVLFRDDPRRSLTCSPTCSPTSSPVEDERLKRPAGWAGHRLAETDAEALTAFPPPWQGEWPQRAYSVARDSRTTVTRICPG